MSDHEKTKEMIWQKRYLFLAVLLFPAIGMLMAIILILEKTSINLVPLSLIIVLLIQYTMTVFLIMQRFNKLLKSSLS